VEEAGESGAVADTYGGRVHVEWDPTAAVTPPGQLPFFAEFLKQSGGLLHCVRPLLSEPWKPDVDTTVKPLYGHQEGAEVGYNPGKRGCPSHSLHTYLMANVRLVPRSRCAAASRTGLGIRSRLCGACWTGSAGRAGRA